MRMAFLRLVLLFGCAALATAASTARAAGVDEYAGLQDEIRDLRSRLEAKRADKVETGPIGRAGAMVGEKYGPNAAVTTKTGALTFGGLVQVWWYTIQNDNRDFNAPFGDPNEFFDNDSYRIRRAELKFSLDITPDITGVIMIDPTGGDEANTFPSVPTNQGVVGKGFFGGVPGPIDPDELNTIDPVLGTTLLEAALANDPLAVGGIARRRMQTGFVRANRVLQDAYINYHPGFMKNHEILVGQFKPPMGEEGNRNSGQLDFVERAMINQFSNQRDLGIMVRGWWFGSNANNAILTYWIGGFNSPGSFHNSFASQQNRSDDNDAKDIAWKLRIRPFWGKETWGSLEFGYSRQDGVHGEAGKGFTTDGVTVTPTVDGLSIQETHANRQYLWAFYAPLGPVRGWWMRGEWARINDRPPPFGGVLALQVAPQPYKREGFYAATGYRMAHSIFADDLKEGGWLKKMLHDVEFTYRYEQFANIVVEDLVNLSRTDDFSTEVQTVGLNVYWKGYNSRTQLNYMFVREPTAGFHPGNAITGPRLRDVNNDMFIISHQVQW